MTPESTAELTITHDEQLWTAFGHVTGHLSDAATQELLAPIAADGAWPERSSHALQRLGRPRTWLGSARTRPWQIGSALRRSFGERTATSAWAAPAPRDEVQAWINVDFPEVGEDLQAPAACR
jgi:hypothetical protein